MESYDFNFWIEQIAENNISANSGRYTANGEALIARGKTEMEAIINCCRKLQKANGEEDYIESLEMALYTLIAAIENGEWHDPVDCEVEKREDDCSLCAAIRIGNNVLRHSHNNAHAADEEPRCVPGQ